MHNRGIIWILLVICVNVILRGKVKEVVETMVEEGYANSQSEAIRLAIIKFGFENLSEHEKVAGKLDRIDREIALGKRKLLSPEEALGNYSKHLK